MSGYTLWLVILAVLHGFSETEYCSFPKEGEKRAHSHSLRADLSIDFQVIQRRTEYEAYDNNFEKKERDYERGFTTQGGALWIGNQILHVLTSSPDNQQVLKIELTRKGQRPTVVYYNKFRVGSEKEKYKLTIGDYQGPPGYDALFYHNGAEFTIKESMTQSPDKDKCSDRLSGGWWFRTCNEANLNGRKFKSSSPIRALGITWHIEDKPESYKYIYDRVEMKIRDKDFGFCTGALKFKIL